MKDLKLIHKYQIDLRDEMMQASHRQNYLSLRHFIFYLLLMMQWWFQLSDLHLECFELFLIDPEMTSKMARFKKLSCLDPSSRLDISLSKEDSPYEQSEKIYAALHSDIVTSNLLNLAWDEFVLQRRYQNFNRLFRGINVSRICKCVLQLRLYTPFSHILLSVNLKGVG